MFSTFGLRKSGVTSQLSRCGVHTLTSSQGFLLSIWLWFLNGSRVPRLNGERFSLGVLTFDRSIPN